MRLRNDCALIAIYHLDRDGDLAKELLDSAIADGKKMLASNHRRIATSCRSSRKPSATATRTSRCGTSSTARTTRQPRRRHKAASNCIRGLAAVARAGICKKRNDCCKASEHAPRSHRSRRRPVQPRRRRLRGEPAAAKRPAGRPSGTGASSRFAARTGLWGGESGALQ